jgi:hypothetical protein
VPSGAGRIRYIEKNHSSHWVSNPRARDREREENDEKGTNSTVKY